MDFSRGVAAFKEWLLSHSSAYKPVRRTVQGSFVPSSRLVVNVPFGGCRIAGCDGTQVELQMQIRAFSDEYASRVSYTTQERDGVTTLLIDGPLSGGSNIATVELELRVPRSLHVDLVSSMGSVNVNDVGSIGVHASMGSVKIVNAHTDCKVDASMGSIKVALAPDWQGAGVALNASMGSATLVVPSNVRLNCSASASLGSVKVSVGSYPDTPNAIVRTELGSARITSA